MIWLYVLPFIIEQFGIVDWELRLPPSEEEDEIAKLRKREIEVNVAASIKNLGFEVDMDDEGRFKYKKELPDQPKEGKDGEPLENDPYAGTNIDQSHIGEMMEGGGKPTQAEAGKPEKVKASRNKPSMNEGPDKGFSGLPKDAGNENVDKRTERRIP